MLTNSRAVTLLGLGSRREYAGREEMSDVIIADDRWKGLLQKSDGKIIQSSYAPSSRRNVRRPGYEQYRYSILTFDIDNVPSPEVTITRLLNVSGEI